MDAGDLRINVAKKKNSLRINAKFQERFAISVNEIADVNQQRNSGRNSLKRLTKSLKRNNACVASVEGF